MPAGEVSFMVRIAPVNYTVRFSGPRDRPKGRDKGKVQSRISKTPLPNKLLPTGDISQSLAGVELSSTNSLPDTTVPN